LSLEHHSPLKSDILMMWMVAEEMSRLLEERTGARKAARAAQQEEDDEAAVRGDACRVFFCDCVKVARMCSHVASTCRVIADSLRDCDFFYRSLTPASES
jgi:hypothetical protein